MHSQKSHHISTDFAQISFKTGENNKKLKIDNAIAFCIIYGVMQELFFYK
jgi:hypothetical protein